MNGDYVAALAAPFQNGFWTSLPGENPAKFLFLKPNPVTGKV
jgi:hypothetical protein